jgi:predicted RNase H-like HicB family nuclease
MRYVRGISIPALDARLFVTIRFIIEAMKIKVVVHEAEEGGYWAEVPAIPGCATQGETFEELLQNLYEAVEGCLSVDVSPAQIAEDDRVLEIAV